MSFKIYVQGRRRGAKPQDDFIAHAQADRLMPDAASWPELKAYLLSCGASPGAIDSARMVWRAYRAKTQRERAGQPAIRLRAA
jgi:hypothetical protein